MSILNKLSIKNLKLNKKRSISTIIAITLSVALICAVATMATSFQKTLVQNAINETGYYHIALYGITGENIKELKNNRDIKEIYEIQDIGYAELKQSKNENKPYVHIYSMNNNTFNTLEFNLIEGRFPTNNNEIIISDHIKSNAKVEYKIGDEITLTVGTRMTEDGYELSKSNPYYSYEETHNSDGTLKEGISEEYIEEKYTKTYTIVGIIKRPNYSFEEYVSPGYTVITTDTTGEKIDAYAVLENPREYETSISEILGVEDCENIKTSEFDKMKYKDINVNQELLRWEVFAFSDSTVSMLYAVIGVVIFIIIFTSVFCIRNSFAIATTEKIKMYGMLSSVGATKKQIRKNVIFEGLILGLIGIPLGIISGILAVFVLLKIVNVLIGDFLFESGEGLIFNVSIIPIIISVILGFITIYLSAISSAKKASKVSPIEQLRSSNDIKINNKKLKTPKIIEKIFKTGGVLAYKNLKRSKKKYRTTVISIAVSICIFIAMNAFIYNAFDLTNVYYEDYDYNIKIYYSVNDITENDIQKIKSLDTVDEIYILYGNYSSLKVKDLSKINTVEGIIELETEYYYEEGNDEPIYTGEKLSNMMVVALDDESFKKYAKKIGADYDYVKNKGILCDEYQYYEDNEYKTMRRYTYKKGDTISGTYKEEEKNIIVGAVTNIRPYGIENTYYGGGYLVVNLDEFKEMKLKIDTITIQSNNPNLTEEQIENIDNTIKLTNIADDVNAQKSMILVVKIFLYGFIAVITLIGVTNIFNTITSNMELRQKEFAMLKSTGMTKKEFNRMINLETLFYGTKSLIYGIVLGLIGTFAMYKAFSVKLDSGMYIPIKPIIISVIAVFILIFIIMRYSISKINKQNTIETIRKDNI